MAKAIEMTDAACAKDFIDVLQLQKECGVTDLKKCVAICWKFYQ